MCNKPNPRCLRPLLDYLKSLPCKLWRYEKKSEAIVAICAMIALWQMPNWLGNQQAAYEGLRSMADAVDKSFQKNVFMQAYWAEIPDGHASSDTQMRMQLALLVITNDWSLEDLKAACEPKATNVNAQIICQYLGTNFLSWNGDSLNLNTNLFGGDHWNGPGKERLRTAYDNVQKYLEVFEMGWSDNKNGLILDKDWRDRLQYMDDMAAHPLFQLAVERCKTNYSQDFIAVAKNPQAEIENVEWRIKHPIRSRIMNVFGYLKSNK